MGLLSRKKKPSASAQAVPSTSIDSMIADAEQRAGLAPGGATAQSAPVLDFGVIIAHGKSLQVLGDRIAVELHPGLGKIGDLFIPDTMKDTRNQTFTRATVVSVGAKVKSCKPRHLVVVSDYFGDEVKLDDGSKKGRKFRIGRERDIVGIDHGFGVTPIGDRVLVERVERPKMAGVLHLPEDMRAQDFEAKVSTAGSEASVKAGQRVLIAKDTSVRVRIDGRVLHLVDEPSILAVL